MGARGKSKLFANAAVATLAGAQPRGASAKERKGTVPSRSAPDPASFSGNAGVDERNLPGTAGQGGDGDKATCLRLLLLRLGGAGNAGAPGALNGGMATPNRPQIVQNQKQLCVVIIDVVLVRLHPEIGLLSDDSDRFVSTKPRFSIRRAFTHCCIFVLNSHRNSFKICPKTDKKAIDDYSKVQYGKCTICMPKPFQNDTQIGPKSHANQQ